MTHAFNYGTGVFEGIRAYWNAAREQLYVLHLREHYERLHRSCRIMRIGLPHSVDELMGITLEVLRRCGYREDAYLRPVAYKSSELIGVRLHDLEDAFTLFAVPFGTYIDIDRGISCGVSSWRRTDDNAIPARSKITGAYVNAALAKTEAQEAGFDEAIVLTADGHVTRLAAAGQVALRYVGPRGEPVGYPGNPNGSADAIAGLVDATGRILGLMPHPERHVDPLQHPRWTREGAKPEADGLRFFRRALAAARHA